MPTSVTRRGYAENHSFSLTTESRTDFDYAESVARHRDTYRPSRNTDLPLKPGDEPLDLISALIQTRYWDLQPGGKRDMLVHFGRELFPVTVHAEKYETVETRLGTFRALRVVRKVNQNTVNDFYVRGLGLVKRVSGEGAITELKEYSGLQPME